MEMPSLEHVKKLFRVETISDFGFRMVAVLIRKDQCRNHLERILLTLSQRGDLHGSVIRDASELWVISDCSSIACWNVG